MADSKLVLYSYYDSSTCWRVRISLKHKNIDHKIYHIDLKNKDQNKEFFIKINPNKAVPALLIDDKSVIIESSAILEYLEDVYPQKPLLPKDDALQKAQIKGFCQVINSSIHPLQNYTVLDQINGFNKDTKIWLQFWSEKGLESNRYFIILFQKVLRNLKIINFLKKAVEQLLEQYSGDSGEYCFGNKITLADLFFFPQIQNIVSRGFDISKYKRIKTVFENLQKMEEFIETSPDKQDDNPNKKP